MIKTTLRNWKDVASFMWTAMLAFCIASTVTDVSADFDSMVFLATFVLSMVVLRVIRHFTVKNEAIFAGAINASSFQSAFTFIFDGIISCFTLGRRMAEGGSIAGPITRIILGILWLVLFLVEIFLVILKNHEDAQLASSILGILGTSFTDEDTQCIRVVMQCNDEPEKAVRWVPTEDEPEDSK